VSGLDFEERSEQAVYAGWKSAEKWCAKKFIGIALNRAGLRWLEEQKC